MSLVTVPISSALLKKFIKLVTRNLKGEWVLLGGTVLPVLGIDYRVTTDIDLVHLDEKSQQSQTLKVMEIAQQLGLPVEAINAAAGYFLFKKQDYQKHLIELHKSKSCTIYRPDVTLYLSLKIGRMNESDLQDCIEYIKYAKREKETWDKNQVLKEIQQALNHKTEENSERKQRLESLLSYLTR